LSPEPGKLKACAASSRRAGANCLFVNLRVIQYSFDAAKGSPVEVRYIVPGKRHFGNSERREKLNNYRPLNAISGAFGGQFKSGSRSLENGAAKALLGARLRTRRTGYEV
jgi:hypothetical protein